METFYLPGRVLTQNDSSPIASLFATHSARPASAAPTGCATPEGLHAASCVAHSVGIAGKGASE